MDARLVPAAHSMDSEWFAVDADGNVGLFHTGETGPRPEDFPHSNGTMPFGGHPDGYTAIREAVGLSEDRDPDDPTPVFRYEFDGYAEYTRHGRPRRPARIEEVPAELRPGLVRLPVRFEDGRPIVVQRHVDCYDPYGERDDEPVEAPPEAPPPKPWWKFW